MPVNKPTKMVSEFRFPFFSMWRYPVAEFIKAGEMCYFVCKGDEKSIRIEIVVDGDGMTAAIKGWTIIAVFRLPGFLDAYTNAVLTNPVEASVDGISRYVFGECASKLFSCSRCGHNSSFQKYIGQFSLPKKVFNV